jgi:hypothetical protein
MSIPEKENDPIKEPIPDIPVEEYARSRLEGAFLSPFGTEGCQWEGFPELPEDLRDDDGDCGPQTGE